ncbi:MAG TPA: hypothetical protein VLV45_07785 [Gemmatimonadales bacterium]|nr:hypothetical protein [Gemmatimonadales bacterium]
MFSKWLGVTLVCAGLAACGTGHATFDVDVYSWLEGSTNDTIPYGAPPGLGTVTISNAPQKLDLLPGAGSSFVDTVRINGTMDARNATGSGSIAFQVYLAADSAGTYAPGAALFNPPPSANVSGANTSVITLTIPNLSQTLDSLFTNSQVWIRLAATVSNPGVSLLQGKAVLTSLNLHLVVSEKVF